MILCFCLSIGFVAPEVDYLIFYIITLSDVNVFEYKVRSHVESELLSGFV